MGLVLQRSYIEPGSTIPSVRLSDEEYGRALQRFIPACTDVLPIDSAKRVIYLARRRAMPNASWWFIGGGTFPHESYPQSAARCFKRETGVDLALDRLTLVADIDYIWKDRAQEPTTIGCHMIGYTFTVEITSEEIAQAAVGLEPTEYHADLGFRAFDRDELIALTNAGEIHPAVLAVYDHCFPQPAQVEFGTLEITDSDSISRIDEQSEMDETYCVIAGGASIRLIEISEDGTHLGKPIEYQARPGDVIKIPARYTRQIELAPNTRLVSFAQTAPNASNVTAS